MGIYVIRKDVMVYMLREELPWANHFRSEVIPGALSLGMKVSHFLVYMPLLLSLLFGQIIFTLLISIFIDNL